MSVGMILLISAVVVFLISNVLVGVQVYKNTFAFIKNNNIALLVCEAVCLLMALVTCFFEIDTNKTVDAMLKIYLILMPLCTGLYFYFVNVSKKKKQIAEQETACEQNK